MNGFYIEVSNGLLHGHRKRMGSAVWEFMWLLDKITKIDEDGIGWVLGGKPVTLAQISEDLEIAQNHVSENLTKLKKEGYLEITRTPHGLSIKVAKAKKRFNQKVKSDFTKRSNHTSEKVISNIRQDSKTRQLDNKKINKRKPFSSIGDLTPEVIAGVATKYRVPVSFVEGQLEKMINWLEAKGRTYKNYLAGLRNWVINDPGYQKAKRPALPPTPEYTMTPEQRLAGRKKLEDLRDKMFKIENIAA